MKQESRAFGQRLARAVIDKKSAVCVGLDPRWQSLPDAFRSGVAEQDWESMAASTTRYCCEVIDAITEHAPVVKPQAAFFEQLGPAGMLGLKQVIEHAGRRGLLVILDGKRGDIGSTAAGYAEAYLGQTSPWGCDALTVNPFLGDDTLQPFIETARSAGAGIFVLVKTSNPGSGFLQDIRTDDGSVSERLANVVQGAAAVDVGDDGLGSIGAVVGATYPAQLAAFQ